MGTVDLKSGFSPATYGAGAGVVLLIILQLITSLVSTGSPQIIPALTFEGNLLQFIGAYFSYFFTTVGGLAFVITTVVFYITATVYVQKSTGTEHETAAVMRGMLIGLASGMNFILAYNIYGMWFGQTTGLIVGAVLFGLGILASVKAVSQNDFFQGLIGWLSWLAPMSWVVLLLGLVLAIISFPLALLGLAGVNFFKLGGAASADPSVQGKLFSVNWKTGTFFLVGGMGSNANYAKTAYNMGNVGFIHRDAQHDHTDHEAGHNLSLFVFGWLVHLLGAVDENVVGYHAQALTELLAESHDHSSTSAKLQMWA